MDEVRERLSALRPWLDLSDLFEEASVAVACCSPGKAAFAKRMQEDDHTAR